MHEAWHTVHTMKWWSSVFPRWPLQTYRTLKVITRLRWHSPSSVTLDCTLLSGRSTMLKYSSQYAGKLDFTAIHMPVASWINDVGQWLGVLEKHFLPVPSITPSPLLIAGLDAKVLLEVQQTNRMSLRCAECYVGPVFPQGKLVQGKNSPILSPSLTHGPWQLHCCLLHAWDTPKWPPFHWYQQQQKLLQMPQSSRSHEALDNLCMDGEIRSGFSDKTMWNREGSTNYFRARLLVISAAELLMFQTITATTSNRANRLTKCKRSASLSKTCQIRASHVAGSSIFVNPLVARPHLILRVQHDQLAVSNTNDLIEDGQHSTGIPVLLISTKLYQVRVAKVWISPCNDYAIFT